MPFNGIGGFTLVAGNPVITGTTISSTTHNNTNTDFANGFANCMTRDGQSPATANIPMGSFKLTGLAAGTTNGDAVRWEQAVLLTQLADTSSASLGAGLVGNATFIAATRTLLKTVTPSRNPVVYLNEAGRQGHFRWTLGDFSTHIAADTQEGIYVLSSLFAATVGAWVRVTIDDELWQTDWFGVPNANSDGTGTQCSAELSALVATANIAQPLGYQFGQGIYSFDSKPTSPTFICAVEGAEAGAQPTVLVKRYLDTAAGLLSFTTHAPRVRNLSIQAIGSGVGAGSLALSAISSTAPIIGVPLIENLRTSMGTANSAEILIDGSLNATAGTVGYRTGRMPGLQCFGNLVMKGCQHWMLSDMFVEDDFIITGTSTVPSDDIHWMGVVGRHWNLSNATAADGYITRCTGHGVVSGSVLNSTTNTTTTFLVGSFGIIAERNWDTTTCRVYSQASIRNFGSNANGIFIIFGTGDIEQWGSVTVAGGAGDAAVTFPTAFTSTVTAAFANVSTAPAAGVMWSASTHTYTLTTLAIRAGSVTFAGPLAAAAPNGTVVKWYAKGS